MFACLCRALISVTLGLASGQQVALHNLQARERELTHLLQAQLQTYQGERVVGNTRFFLGKGADEQGADPTTTAQALNIPAQPDVISPKFFNNAAKVISSAGLSTPVPEAASINAPPKPPTPMPFEAVMQEPEQPLDTKLGSAIIYGVAGGVTPTPPPKQATISQQFIAQCPMVLFGKDLSVRGQACGAAEGRWVDPSPLNPNRTAVRWRPTEAGGLYFGVDSALTGLGSALFADISQVVTLTGYHFVMKNCLGVERWHLEETVYKVDSMGKVSSTMELHDITMNSEAFFLRYIIRSATGMIAAESSLFRMNQNEVNFTEWKDGLNTGKLLAVAKRQGTWTQKGWEACMSPTSPRGWSINFPADTRSFPTAATVQDIRVAITGAITLMGYRDENRAKDGLNTEGRAHEITTFVGGVVLIFFLCIFLCNFCMVFRGSGLQAKLKRLLFESQGAFLPKRPFQDREPPLNPAYY